MVYLVGGDLCTERKTEHHCLPNFPNQKAPFSPLSPSIQDCKPWNPSPCVPRIGLHQLYAYAELDPEAPRATSRPDTMTDSRDADLALLSGEELVDLLRTTYRRTDFEAVARVLKARDRKIAEVEAALEAALAGIDSLRKKYDAYRRARDEAEEMALPVGIAAHGPVQREKPRVEEAGEDTVPLGQPLKRLRQGEVRAVESRKRDGLGQSNSVGTLGNDQQKSLSAGPVGPEARTGRMVGTSENSKVAAVLQGRGAVEPEKLGGEMPSRMQLISQGLLDRSVLPKGSSKSDHARANISNKEGSSDSVPARGVRVSQPPKGNGKMNETSMVESSSRCGNKEARTDMQKCPSLFRQTEERGIAREGVPFEETRMAASSSSLSIRTLSGPELRRYFFKSG